MHQTWRIRVLMLENVGCSAGVGVGVGVGVGAGVGAGVDDGSGDGCTGLGVPSPPLPQAMQMTALALSRA
jgi:hypothetical protein